MWEVANLIPTKEEWMDALITRHGADIHQRFSSATVAICGLGGLGSNIAIALARAGIGKLLLIDFDRVDITNLHRQQYKANQIGFYKTDALTENLREIAPYTEVLTVTAKITEDNFAEILKDADVICEALDRAEAKAMLVNGVWEQLPDRYLVAESGMAGMDAPNSIQTRKVMGRFYLCGDAAAPFHTCNPEHARSTGFVRYDHREQRRYDCRRQANRRQLSLCGFTQGGGTASTMQTTCFMQMANRFGLRVSVSIIPIPTAQAVHSPVPLQPILPKDLPSLNLFSEQRTMSPVLWQLCWIWGKALAR